MTAGCASTDTSCHKKPSASVPAATAPVAAPVGETGNFTLDLATYDGGRFSFEDIRGKKHLLLAFWATWCDPCKAELRELAALYDRYRDKVEFVAVSTDTEESMDKVRAFAIESNLPFPILVDPSKKQVVSLIPGGDTVPYSMLVSREGKVLTTHTGYEPGDEERVARELDELISK
jgi:peroxiredoxin